MSSPPGPTATESLGPYSGADDPSAASMLNVATGDNSTFLRGVWQTEYADINLRSFLYD